MTNLLIASILLVQQAQLHDIHLSRTLVHYNLDNTSLEISMHIFIDDLELSLQEDGHDSLFIATQMEAANADELIAAYINNHFALQYADSPVTFNFLGKEISDDLMAIWCYLEVQEVPTFDEIFVHNSILTELYRDQSNIVQLDIGKKKKYLLFDANKLNESVRF